MIILKKGIGLVEVVVAIAVISTVLGLSVSIAALSLRIATKAKVNIQLTLLAEEGIEGVRAVRIANNGVLPDSGSYCIDVAGTTISLKLVAVGCSGVAMPAGFTRTIVVDNASSNGGVLGGSSKNESSARQVTVTVANGDAQKTLVTVLGDITE